ncbi:MAG: sensor protein KdpD [Saprospirales bacterium]|nr:sensor protein KdpD [Saprospirales bacterium]
MPHSPDYFLQLIQKSRRGRLKIYIGMIAGVGKSYRMLQEAHQLQKAGENVAIGFIETHGRPETEALLAGLSVIPRKKVFYKGKELEEMDLEAILTERPEVVIVDELAHTNIPGSVNEKRWQDVRDLIQAGINVITAFNVQHLESLNDKVFTVSGIEVSERIPDTLFAEADEVVNIDLPAEDLIQRLKEGKIYKGEKIQSALDNFFQAEKILQLRELALLQVAKNLERKIDRTSADKQTIVERFMACISTNEKMATKVIRKTARLATNYKADWFVVYVQAEAESAVRIESRVQTKLLQNMKLAAELGAKVLQVQGNENIPDALFKAAMEHKATNIVIGRPNQSIWRAVTGKNYFAKLVRKIAETDIDLIVVT